MTYLQKDWEELLKQKISIIVDTNFFLACLEKKIYLPEAIDKVIVQAYQLVLPLAVLKEFEELKLRKKHTLVELAIKISKKHAIMLDENIFLDKIPLTVDEIVIELAQKLAYANYNIIVASADKKIQQKVQKSHIPILTIIDRRLRVINK